MAPPKGGFYAVRNGRVPGVYFTWEECEAQIKGFHGAKYKKFASLEDANSFTSGLFSNDRGPAVLSDSASGHVKGKKRAFGPEVADTSGWDIVYSDGACKGNGKVGSVAGVGVWWGSGDPRNFAERCPGDQTNNRAELIAILRVLETAPLTKKPLLIRTDSQYAIQCVRDWITKWQAGNWKTSTGMDVKNAGIIRCVSKQLDIRAKSGQRVVLEYVKGHSGDVGNDGADALANKGAVLPVAPERDWDAMEKQLEKRLSRIVYDGEAPKVTILADGPPDRDNPGAPPKIQKVLDPEGSFTTSKIVAQRSSPLKTFTSISPKGKQQSPFIGEKSNSSKLTLKQNDYQPSLSTTWEAKKNQDPNPKPITFVPVQDLNLNDYEDCLLNDEDLANERFD